MHPRRHARLSVYEGMNRNLPIGGLTDIRSMFRRMAGLSAQQHRAPRYRFVPLLELGFEQTGITR